ncbi:NAD-dependent epimerase/dehydratase family protein [Pseudooceanicola sediminis]|uniref:UDP-glucose 4-epimerase n=1 Tax=Pseudooceanicola sediminis TaxID=2211117 RepID=A0A399J7U2_9RHOB|nr:NAD-dependent epimerase/dehydratase family protein [Pseudooceanicola sediminis]KAA2311455.1 NAD-dependent epimerase/dehydratase family protein [Puniceibacterium sp. HSS470]RII40062.1 NAD-dependent epimerase/dehydratase family protein [Pseudooceanicola sediminis]|tara:strand:+ start:1259 stop:2170 length:912 start_codon:yes stop_codon:yes gene_type:complete
MRVLVLGGSGFIGSHVVDQLLAADVKVRVFDRGPERYREKLPGVEYLFGDFRDSVAVIEALADCDVVLHLVTATVPGTAAMDPLADVRDNLLPTIALLEGMVKVKVPRLVYLSSGGTVYGVPEAVPTPENHPLRPINSYGIVKVAIENYVTMYGREHGISTVIIRPSNPYGPRQGHTGLQGIIGTFLNRILNDEAIQIWGDGSVVRDYIYVEDVARLCCRAAFGDRPGVYNAGSGSGLSVNEIVEALRDVTGKDIQPTYLPGRAIDVPRSVLDISQARAEFDWEPVVASREGIDLTWKWMREL